MKKKQFNFGIVNPPRFDGSEKDVEIFLGDGRVRVDYDDVDHDEARVLISMIVALPDFYNLARRIVEANVVNDLLSLKQDAIALCERAEKPARESR